MACPKYRYVLVAAMGLYVSPCNSRLIKDGIVLMLVNVGFLFSATGSQASSHPSVCFCVLCILELAGVGDDTSDHACGFFSGTICHVKLVYIFTVLSDVVVL